MQTELEMLRQDAQERAKTEYTCETTIKYKEDIQKWKAHVMINGHHTILANTFDTRKEAYDACRKAQDKYMPN